VMYGNMKAIETSTLGRTADPYVLIQTSLTGAGIDPAVFRNELLSDPDIKAVTASQIPILTSIGGTATISRSMAPGAPVVTVLRRPVGESYFSTLEIPFLAGRAPSTDRGGDIGPPTSRQLSSAATGPNLVIDRSTAEALGWRDAAAAVGQVIYLHVGGGRAIPADIIGVTENIPFQVSAPISSSYIYYLQPQAASLPIVRIAPGHVREAVAHIDAVWNRLAPDIPMRRSFMDEQLARALALDETIGTAFMALALFAVFIASMGLIGMASYVVGRRRREIGVRKTLGATTTQVLARLIWEFSRPVLIANIAVWPIAYLGMEAYLSLFSMHGELTPLPFLLTLAATLAVTWAAVGMQAFRAARVKPAKVLRYE